MVIVFVSRTVDGAIIVGCVIGDLGTVVTITVVYGGHGSSFVVVEQIVV